MISYAQKKKAIKEADPLIFLPVYLKKEEMIKHKRKNFQCESINGIEIDKTKIDSAASDVLNKKTVTLFFFTH